MPRIAEAREPAEPTSEEQKERYVRILRAAGRLGAEHGHERMQMNDVAKEAGVAIATLYRYFPSKTDLFVAVLHRQVDNLSRVVELLGEGSAPVDRVSELLIHSSRALLERPLLATATLQANNAAQLQSGRKYTAINESFHDVVLGVLDVAEPVEEDLRMVRLIEQTWFGILISVLNGVIDIEQAEKDIWLGCTLLLGPRYGEGKLS